MHAHSTPGAPGRRRSQTAGARFSAGRPPVSAGRSARRRRRRRVARRRTWRAGSPGGRPRRSAPGDEVGHHLAHGRRELEAVARHARSDVKAADRRLVQPRRPPVTPTRAGSRPRHRAPKTSSSPLPGSVVSPRAHRGLATRQRATTPRLASCCTSPEVAQTKRSTDPAITNISTRRARPVAPAARGQPFLAQNVRSARARASEPCAVLSFARRRRCAAGGSRGSRATRFASSPASSGRLRA